MINTAVFENKDPRKEVYMMAMTNKNTQHRQGALNIGRGPQWKKTWKPGTRRKKYKYKKIAVGDQVMDTYYKKKNTL